jgi:hypothetical protein
VGRCNFDGTVEDQQSFLHGIVLRATLAAIFDLRQQTLVSRFVRLGKQQVNQFLLHQMAIVVHGSFS